MAPDTPADEDGCFSGSAITLKDGRQLLMYTGCRKEVDAQGKKKGIQQQCIAVGDGLNYEKYEGNPVLSEKDLPEGGSKIDFRDPRIFQAKDGTYLAVVGNRPADGSGQILLFQSPDGFSWSFKSILIKNENRYGRMWECPDFFPLDDKWVLLTSPQDMMPQGFEFHNGNGTLCLIGDFDEEAGTFTPSHAQAIDYGIDFYAPQTLLTKDNRRLMIGWMQNPDTGDLHMENRLWCGQMSLGRELFLKDGRLCQRPLKELALLRRDEVSYENIPLEGSLSLPGICGRSMELEIEVRDTGAGNAKDSPKEKAAKTEGKNAASYHKFTLQFAANSDYHTNLSYRPREATLKIDRKFSGSRRAIIHQRMAKVETKEGTLRLHVILDRYSVEVFIGEGEQVMTATLYTDLAAQDIRFICDGSATLSVRAWQLVP